MGHRVRDKIRVNVGSFAGQRGFIEKVAGTRLQVRLRSPSRLISIEERFITNYSAAARKAWETMPKRKVGRPSGTKVVDRISVTFRVDRTLWAAFRKQEARGSIVSRSETIESLLRERLGMLDRQPS